MDIRGRAVELVALSVLSDRVDTRTAEIKREVADALDIGDRKTAALDSGVKVGSITFANGSTKARVVDERALLEFVRANYPDEIVETVRPAFQTLLLTEAKRAGAAVDFRTGELLPGVEVYTGRPYITVSKNDDAIPALLDAIRAQQLLALDGIPDPPEYDHDADFEPVHDGEAV